MTIEKEQPSLTSNRQTQAGGIGCAHAQNVASALEGNSATHLQAGLISSEQRLGRVLDKHIPGMSDRSTREGRMQKNVWEKRTYRGENFWTNGQERYVLQKRDSEKDLPDHVLERLCEWCVGDIISGILKKLYPEAQLFHASDYDDLFAGVDIIIAQGEVVFAIDLAIILQEDSLYLSKKRLNKTAVPIEFNKFRNEGFVKKSIPREVLRISPADFAPLLLAWLTDREYLGNMYGYLFDGTIRTTDSRQKIEARNSNASHVANIEKSIMSLLGKYILKSANEQPDLPESSSSVSGVLNEAHKRQTLSLKRPGESK